MPELPEVERAVVQLRRHVVGRSIQSLEIHHPALRRRLSAKQRRALIGARITGVRRRGKHQLIDLDDGRILHAHFRMTGDWVAGAPAKGARYPRATLLLDDDTRVVLDDPRALATLTVWNAGDDPVAAIGVDADDPALTAAAFGTRIARRRAPIKQVLLDQSVLAGIGNIYAAESLWRARIDPRRPASSLSAKEVGTLLSAIRAVLRKASGARYSDGAGRFDVYDREGKKCRRCGKGIDRIVQGARSTYFCPGCQS
jgi:formamidopyrimidine-DNA glycosylase